MDDQTTSLPLDGKSNSISDYVKGLTQQERLDRFWELFEESYFDKTVKFERDGRLYEARIDRITRKENVNKRNTENQWDKAKARLGADGDFVTLLENARYDMSKPNNSTSKNEAHKGVESFDYFEKTVVVDGRPYDVVINVRIKNAGEYVYDVKFTPNKKDPALVRVSPI